VIRPFRSAAVAALLLTTSAAPPAPPAPRGTLAQLFSDADYPTDALRRHEQGKVDFRLDIDAAGAVAGCTVTHSSGSASLDEATCRILRERARFRPARDADGKARTDRFEGHIIWRTGNAVAPPEFEAAAHVWMRCLAEAVRPRLAGSETAQSLVAMAFDACTAEEAQLAAVGAKTLSAPPAVGSESMRKGVREALLQSIAAARARPDR
jgi:TonB family protein